MTFRIYPLKKVILYVILFPFEQLEDSLDYWQHWAPETDPAMNSEYRFNNGRQQPKISGLFFGPKGRALELLKPFKKFCPDSFRVEEVEYPTAAEEFAGKGRWLAFSKAKNGFVSEFLPRKALNIISKFMAQGSGNSVFELNALGAKFNLVKPDETAFIHRTSLYWFLINAHWDDELTDSAELIKERKGCPPIAMELKWANDFYAAMLPYLNGEVYQNMPDSTVPNALGAYYGCNLKRLKQIKAKYDPHNRFNYLQSIPLPKKISGRKLTKLSPNLLG
jgi:FAD/FMN-containing dehydrogenase